MKIAIALLLSAGLLMPALVQADCLASNDPSKKIWTLVSQSPPHALRWHERFLVRMMLWRAERKAHHRVVFYPTTDCDTIVLTNGRVLMVHVLEYDYENLTVTPCEKEQGEKRTIPWSQVKYARRAGGPVVGKPSSPLELVKMEERKKKDEERKKRLERIKNRTPAEIRRHEFRPILIVLIILVIIVLIWLFVLWQISRSF